MSKTTVLHKVEKTSKERLEELENQISALTEGFKALAEANQTQSLQIASVTLALQGQIKRNNTLRAELGALVEIVGEGGAITKESVKERVVAASVAELKRRIDVLLESGDLVPTDEVAADSLIVGQQEDKEGNIVNAR